MVLFQIVLSYTLKYLVTMEHPVKQYQFYRKTVGYSPHSFEITNVISQYMNGNHNHFVKTRKPKLIGQSLHISYISRLYKMLFTVRKIYVFDKIV